MNKLRCREFESVEVRQLDDRARALILSVPTSELPSLALKNACIPCHHPIPTAPPPHFTLVSLLPGAGHPRVLSFHSAARVNHLKYRPDRLTPQPEALLGLPCCSSPVLRAWSLLPFLCTTVPAAAAAKSHQSCLTLCDPIDGSPQAPPPLGLSRQEHWSGLPFPSLMHESEK